MSLTNNKINRVVFKKEDLLKAIRLYLLEENADGNIDQIANLSFNIGLDGGFDSLDGSATVLTLELPL